MLGLGNIVGNRIPICYKGYKCCIEPMEIETGVLFYDWAKPIFKTLLLHL